MLCLEKVSTSWGGQFSCCPGAGGRRDEQTGCHFGVLRDTVTASLTEEQAMKGGGEFGVGAGAGSVGRCQRHLASLSPGLRETLCFPDASNGSLVNEI